MKTISFIIPVYNEEKGIKSFTNTLLFPVIEKITEYKSEIIFVNDSSSDNSLQILHKLADKRKNVKVIGFSRNFGKEMALSAGMKVASGDAVITLDADGQQPPKLIPDFIKAWENGADVVIGVRGKYEKHGLIAKAGSKLFYKLLSMMGVKDTVPGSTDFRLISRKVVDEFNKLTEHQRITRGLLDWMGFKKTYIDYVYGNRLAGKPSYNFKKLFGLAIDSFVSLSTAPIVFFGWIGIFITALSGLLGLFALVELFLLNDPMNLNWTGATCLGIFISFLVGLVLVSQASTSLYISHIHAETKNRPLYIIDKDQSKNI